MELSQKITTFQPLRGQMVEQRSKKQEIKATCSELNILSFGIYKGFEGLFVP